MAQKRTYTVEELVEIYRQYAQLKGWSTNERTVRDKVEAWVDSSIGPVGLAIQFHERRTDGAKHLGYDAEARAGGASIQRLTVTLAGTEYANSDGTSRQEIAAQCAPLEVLRVRHEPDNRFDPNAVGVFRKNRQQLGYLPRRLAAETVTRMNQGFRHVAVIDAVKTSNKFVIDIGRGTTANPCDVVIALFIVEPSVQTEEWEKYYRSWATDRRQSGARG
jgi:hypothetical protein